MTKYIYDINYGHYIPLNEGEAAEEQTANQDGQNDALDEPKSSLINLNNEDVLKVKQEKTNKLKGIDERIRQKNNNILLVQQTVNTALDNGQPTNNALKQLLLAKKELVDLKFERAKIEHDMDNKILLVLQSLVESIIMNTYPSRYNGLNEEQLQQSKIYLNTLIESDGCQIIKEMADFKKIMGHANLLYGKDANGYFAICIDNYDLNRLSAVLEKAGYLKEAIMGCCFSQLYL